MKMLRVKFFASLRETLGVDSIEFDILEGSSEQQDLTNGKRIVDIKHALVSRGAPWDALNQQELLCALNQSICSQEAIAKPGDEVAFFPPVTGG